MNQFDFTKHEMHRELLQFKLLKVFESPFPRRMLRPTSVLKRILQEMNLGNVRARVRSWRRVGCASKYHWEMRWISLILCGPTESLASVIELFNLDLNVFQMR